MVDWRRNWKKNDVEVRNRRRGGINEGKEIDDGMSMGNWDYWFWKEWMDGKGNGWKECWRLYRKKFEKGKGMNNRIEKKLEEMKEEGSKEIVKYLMGGDKDMEKEMKVMKEMKKEGDEVIEIGMKL